MTSTEGNQDAFTIIRRYAKLGLGLLALCCTVTGSAAGQDGGDSAGDTQMADLASQKQTVAELREVGTALMSWLTDAVTGDGTTLPPGVAEHRDTGWMVRRNAEGEPMTYSEISYATIQEILTPDYIEAVPENDGWGHPYDFTLNADLLGKAVLGIRSAGRDGRFETDDYVVGGFPAPEVDHDLVWVDGYSIQWPQMPAE